mgnify:FL=1
MTESLAMTLLMLLLAASLAAGQDVPPNLAPNASFEEGDGFGPEGWETRPAPGSTSRFEWAEGVAHTGSRSLFIGNHLT